MTLSRRNIITGGDGIWVDELNARITQNNDAMKEDFLYYLTESPVTGTRGYAKIPAAKFVIGLPSNNDAAATGYVVNKQAVYNAFSRLDAKNLSIKGLMTGQSTGTTARARPAWPTIGSSKPATRR